jgi:hypothetical protein
MKQIQTNRRWREVFKRTSGVKERDIMLFTSFTESLHIWLLQTFLLMKWCLWGCLIPMKSPHVLNNVLLLLSRRYSCRLEIIFNSPFRLKLTARSQIWKLLCFRYLILLQPILLFLFLFLFHLRLSFLLPYFLLHLHLPLPFFIFFFFLFLLLHLVSSFLFVSASLF